MWGEFIMFNLKLSVSVSAIKPMGFSGDRFHYDINDKFKQKLIDAKNLGFEAVEIGINGTYNPFEVDELIDEIIEQIIESGIKVNSFHIPFAREWTDLCETYEPDRVGFIGWIKNLFKKLEKVNPRAFVLHPGAMSVRDAEKSFEALCKSADELAESTNVFVCIENMVRSQVFERKEQFVKFKNTVKKAKMVLDVNHLLHDRAEDILLELGGDFVKTLHISDYDFENERHWLPKEGKNDWMKIISALEKIGYDGVFNYEVNASYSLEQIKANFDELKSEYISLKK